MIFDLGCCCSQPITGLYDFYGVGSYGQITTSPATSDVFSNELDNILVRNRAYRTKLPEASFPGTIDLVNGKRITSFIEDWWISAGSGTGVNDIILDDGIEQHFAIAPFSSSERYWVQRQSIVTGLQSYNIFGNDVVAGLGTGWVLGPHTVLGTGSISLSGITGATSGCFIYRSFGTGEIPNYINLQLHENFDKNILLTLETTPNTIFGNYSGFNIWINNTGQTLSTLISPTGSSLFLWTPERSVVGNYYNYKIETKDLIYSAFNEAYSDYDPITGVKISLVDDRSGYTLNDVSGFSADIRQLYFSNTKRESAFIGSDQIVNDLFLIDSVNKSIIKRIVPPTGYSLFDNISGTDFARVNNFTGQNLLLENNYINGAATSLIVDPASYYSMSNRYHTNASMYIFGSTYDDSSQGLVLEVSGDFGDGGYQEGNVRVQGQNNNQFNSVTCISSNGDDIAFISFEPINFHIRPNPMLLISHLNNVSNPIRENYDSILTYSRTGERRYVFGESWRLHDFEYHIPTGELYTLFTSGSIGRTYYPADISNYNNTGNVFPNINLFVARSHPNCFSVNQPKLQFVHSTGGTGLLPLSQTVEILYGPYKTGVHKIHYISGHGDTAPVGMNFTGINKTFFTYNDLSIFTKTGAFYEINRYRICGDKENSQVFWSDSLTQNRKVYALNSTTGIYRIGDSETVGFNGDYTSHNVTAQVLFGDEHQGTPGAIFIHSRNYTGSSQIINSGECYLKIKIGDNIVLNKRIYDKTQYIQQSRMAFARGLTALQPTESSQRANISGNSAAFAWFEKLWSVEPSYNTTGLETGWRLNVSNSTGGILWHLDSTGYHALEDYSISDTFRRWRKPNIVASSDRYIYINDFFLPRSGVVSEDFNLTNIYPTGTSFPLSGSFYYVVMSGNYINAGDSFAISHDGRSVMPISRDYNGDTLFGSRLTTTYTRTSKIGDTVPYESYGFINFSDLYTTDSVKNSDLIPYCPPYSKFLTNITGTVPTIRPLCTGVNSSGMGLNLYQCISGSIIIGSGTASSGLYS